MANRKQMLHIVSPHSTRRRTVRVPFILLILLVSVGLVGIAGFFFTFSSGPAALSKEKKLQELVLRNNALQQRVSMGNKLLNQVRTGSRALESDRSALEAAAGLQPLKVRMLKGGGNRTGSGALAEAELMVDKTDSLGILFCQRLWAGAGLIDSLPVRAPVAWPYAVSVPFGNRADPFTGGLKNHAGVDLAAVRESAVVASAAGVVERVENDHVWGIRIRIRHAYGFLSVYAHLGSATVVAGSRIRSGDKIGTVGMTGIATGPHVHFEVWKEGVAVDPQLYFFPLQDSAQIQISQMPQ